MDINDINKYCKRIRSKTYWELSISNEIKELIYQNVITVTKNTIFYFSLWFDGSPLRGTSLFLVDIDYYPGLLVNDSKVNRQK